MANEFGIEVGDVVEAQQATRYNDTMIVVWGDSLRKVQNA